MAYQQENFGIMDEGYFVPRTQILAWLNNLLELNLTKIQQLGSGAVYCQVIDVVHQGKISLSKVNWKAKNDYEFVNNLKILQNAFDKIGIKRHVEVEKLSKAKYQDNLEFIQWMKRYYDVNCGQRGNNYMAQERRGNVAVDFSFAEKNVIPKTFNGGGQVRTPRGGERKPFFEEKKEVLPKVKVQKKKETGKKTKPLEPITQIATNTKMKTEKIEDEEEKFKVLQEELEYYKESNRKNREKLEMVSEVLKTEDGCELKLQMVQEILKQL